MKEQSTIHVWAEQTRETLAAHIAHLKTELEYALGLQKAFTVMGKAVGTKPTVTPEPSKRTRKRRKIAKRGPVLSKQTKAETVAIYLANTTDQKSGQTRQQIATALGKPWTAQHVSNVLTELRKQGIVDGASGVWYYISPEAR